MIVRKMICDRSGFEPGVVSTSNMEAAHAIHYTTEDAVQGGYSNNYDTPAFSVRLGNFLLTWTMTRLECSSCSMEFHANLASQIGTKVYDGLWARRICLF